MHPSSKFRRTRVVIDSKLFNHFVDPDLRVQTSVKKAETVKNWGVELETRDIDTLLKV